MNRTVRTHVPFLQLIYQTSSAKQRKALVNTITSEQLHALCEVLLNVYRGTIFISPQYVRKFQPYKTLFRTIISRRVSKKRKKKVLLKRHKALPLLLKPFLTTLTEENGSGIGADAQGKIRNLEQETGGEQNPEQGDGQ